MRRLILIAAAALTGGAGVLLAAARSRPVLFKINPNIGAVMPRRYCVLNPFRDREPERVSERYLAALREGKADVITPFVAPHKLDHVLSRARDFRVLSWRISYRPSDGATEYLAYWARRDRYPVDDEEEVMLKLEKQSGHWVLRGYQAIY